MSASLWTSSKWEVDPAIVAWVLHFAGGGFIFRQIFFSARRHPRPALVDQGMENLVVYRY